MTFSPKLNLTIPGQMTEAELRALANLAHDVPENGIIVEVGSLYGLSSWHWAQNSRESVTVHCIDPWQRVPWIVNIVEQPQNAPTFGIEAFQRHVADCQGVIAHQGFSPQICAAWTQPIHIFFDDAVHENPILRQNIDFWEKFVVSGGYVCGHDYGPLWPDVRREADRLAQAWGVTVETTETFWWVKRP